MVPQKSFVNTYLMSSIVAIFVTVFLALVLIFLNGQERTARQSAAFLEEYTAFKKAAIKNEIGIVMSLINSKIARIDTTSVSARNQAQAEVLNWINTIRLRENQYVVVNTMDGTILAHFKPENIGKNMWGFQDVNGVKAVQEATQVAQQKEGGFVSYVGSIRPATGKPGRKITYAKSVPQWGWVVTTGVYLDDIEKAAAQHRAGLSKNLKQDFIGVSFALLIALAVAFMIVRLISGRMKANFAALNDFFISAASRSARIDSDKLFFKEFKGLALPVNEMVGAVKEANEQLRRQQQLLEAEVDEQTIELKREFERQKQIQEELQESEATLKSVFRAAPVGIGMVINRVIQQANSRLCEIIGYSRDDLVGQSARMLYPTDEDFEYVGREKYRQISEKGTGTVETRWQRKSGEIIDVLLSSTPLNQEDWSAGVTFTALDITARKQSRLALRKSEEKFRNIFESLMDVYFETTLAGEIKNCSPSVEIISGWTPDELIGKQVNVLYNNPGDRELLLKALRQNGSVRGFELLFKKKNGDVYDVSINADIYTDDDGQPAGLIGTIRDVTLQKELENKLQRSRKMESLGVMAGGIAHDLNNILTGIVSYPDLLLMEIPDDSPMRRPVEVIRDSGRRASEVVADLLTIAKGVAAGKEVTNLNTLVGEYFKSAEFQQLTRDHPGVAFKRNLDAELLNVRCSPPHMKKILMNLVANAAEAIERKGEVDIRTTNRYLDKPLRGYEDIQIGEYVLLRVADSGGGISRENIDRIFEPFYTKKVMGRSGTGLGLAVVWNTVQDHDGYINVDSSRMGTVFELYFPVTRAAAAPDARQVAIDHYLGNGERILVVDDEENQREVACQLVKKLNYHATAVSSGEEAIAYLKSQTVDLLVLDMIMPPGMNGRETFAQAKTINPNQRAIIASGFAETEEVKAAQALGAGDYLKKPYTLEKIGLAIKTELDTVR
jgi:PAS domain S-box-containing protein